MRGNAIVSISRSIRSAAFFFFFATACLTASGQETVPASSFETAHARAEKLDLVRIVRFETTADAKSGAGESISSLTRSAASVGWQQDQTGKTTTPPKRVPLTSEEKMNRAFKAAFLTPTAYLSSAVGAAITEWREDDLPHKTNEDRVADFGSRLAIRFSTRATRTLFGSGIYPILFKQDPRYRPAGKKNPLKRALHAASRVFVTDDDDGNLEPNYSNFAGAMTASALANIWEQSTPGHDRIGRDATVKRFARSFSSVMINNILFKEFLPDLIKIIRRK